MSRYIDADKLIKSIPPYRGEYPVMMKAVWAAIDATPTADVVEVRHAYWKETTHITESKRGREIHSKLYNCSYCDAPNGRKKSSYCHWCGAKMDGERREENERLKAQKYYIHSDGRIEMIPTVESVRADTVRTMQERLKADAVTIQDHTGKLGVVVGVGNIDDVAREMLEVAKRREDIENSPVDCSTPSVTESQREADER